MLVNGFGADSILDQGFRRKELASRMSEAGTFFVLAVDNNLKRA